MYAAYSGMLKDYAGVVLVNGSEDDGETWHRPAVAARWSQSSSVEYSELKIAASLQEDEGNWVYVTARGYSEDCKCQFIRFTRSADRGRIWGNPLTLAYGAYDIPTSVSGASVAGGIAGEVLVSWREVNKDEGTTKIKVARSRNHGASFNQVVDAATFAGSSYWHRPDIEIGAKGVAHVVYVGQGDDIRYIWSGPPYTSWSQPVTANDGPQMPYYHISEPSLVTQTCGTSTILHVVWNDTRMAPADSPGNYGDVYYARKVAKSGAVWSKNIRISGKSSLQFDGYAMAPDVAVSRGRLFAVWTDRRDKTDPNDYETDVYGSGILSGITCR